MLRLPWQAGQSAEQTSYVRDMPVTLFTGAVVLQVAQGILLPTNSTQLGSHAGTPARTVIATPTHQSVHLDGRLNEPAWTTAPPISDFYQSNPHEGEPASQRTEVRVLYDAGSLYVGARMYESDPQRIRAVLARHDDTGPSDNFTVALDTYHDHQTAMRFTVNPLGVRSDELTQGDIGFGDPTWDPVWEADAEIDSLGWSVEIRIPLSQLRVPARKDQIWGINFHRSLASRQETDDLVLTRRTDIGYVSRFAHLTGLRGIRTPRGIELRPFAQSQLETHPIAPEDPPIDTREINSTAGLDARLELGANVSVDATIYPDFGEVEQDPAELNLTPYESFFDERRPFFVEGAQLFDFAGAGGSVLTGGVSPFFYSRRIGRQPSGFPDLLPALLLPADSMRGPAMELPKSAPILGAARLAGRSGGTSVGLLHAEVGRAYGEVRAQAFSGDSIINLDYRDELEPRAHYSAARVKQDFRGGATTLGLLLTQTHRDLRTPRLDSLFRSHAYSGGLDWQHRWSQNRLSFSGYLGGSYILGSAPAITETQLAPARYYQRPDQGHVRVDSTRTSLIGAAGEMRFGYQAPSGIFTTLKGGWISPGFETNDIGFLSVADELSGSIEVGWRQPRPSQRFRSSGITLRLTESATSWGTHLDRSAGISLSGSTQGGWSGSLGFSYSFGGLSKDATRGGPLMLRGRKVAVNYTGSSDPRGPLSFVTYANIDGSKFGDRSAGFGAYLNWRPRANLYFSLGPTYSVSKPVAHYTSTVTDPLATATYGKRYVFAELNQKILSLVTRANVTFTPALSLELYLQLFSSGATYSDFKELREPRSFDFLRYGESGSEIARDPIAGGYRVDPDGSGPGASFKLSNPDIALRSLRGTAVLRWEYMPGGTIFLVWNQSRAGFDPSGRFGGFGDFPDLFDEPSENIFLIKMSYWLAR
jgi:hypothetical protein